MCKKVVSVLSVIALFVAFMIGSSASDAQTSNGVCFAVVVHADNPVNEIDAERLTRMMLRKDTRWDDGTRAVPVDRETDARVRESFSRSVLGKPPSAIESYWQRMIFSGRGVPPVRAASDEEVIAVVRADRGALGYVRCSAVPADGVKVLAVNLPEDED